MVMIEQSAQAAFERARAHLRDLEERLAELPTRYREALRHGDAARLKAVRVAKIDTEEELAVARIVATRAEVALLTEEIAALSPREQEASRDVLRTFAAVETCKAALEEALALSNGAQNRAGSIRAERQELVGRKMDLDDRLKVLAAATMPE